VLTCPFFSLSAGPESKSDFRSEKPDGEFESSSGTYGEPIVATLSRQLVSEFGRGFEDKNLRRMLQFAEAFPDEAIVATLWRQLSWSHFRELLPLAKSHQREFNAEMCRIEGWCKSLACEWNHDHVKNTWALWSWQMNLNTRY
jgi:hypothetical protein